MNGRIRVDIISDIVCPWCFIGFRQLERALAIAGLEGDIRWHPFELNPDMDDEGEELQAHIARKYGATDEGSAITRRQIRALGDELGIDFSKRATMIWNTSKAHQLLYWAKDSGRQTDLHIRLFEAYFTRGRNIGDTGVLLDAAADAGLDRAEAAEVLADGRFGEAVRALEARWRDMGINGVPAMIFEERALVMGAQEPERLANALTRMMAAALAG